MRLGILFLVDAKTPISLETTLPLFLWTNDPLHPFPTFVTYNSSEKPGGNNSRVKNYWGGGGSHLSLGTIILGEREGGSFVSRKKV